MRTARRARKPSSRDRTAVIPSPALRDEIVVIRTYVSEMEAQVAQLVLAAHEIPAVLLRDDAGGMLPAMRLLFPVRLAVRRDQEGLAKRVLDSEPGEG